MKVFKSNKTGTVNRGTIKKLIEAGVLVASCNYRLSDDYAFDNATNFGKTDFIPARLKKDSKDWQEGFANFDDYDFKTKSGKAWLNQDGKSITLKIHENESWDLKFKENE